MFGWAAPGWFGKLLKLVDGWLLKLPRGGLTAVAVDCAGRPAQMLEPFWVDDGEEL
jgi:hypothetical protein